MRKRILHAGFNQKPLLLSTLTFWFHSADRNTINYNKSVPRRSIVKLRS